MRWRRPTLLLLLLTLVVRAPSFVRPVMDDDEAEYVGIACRMLEGGLPYRDGMAIKPPGAFYFYTGVFRVFGRGNMLAIHILVALLAFATALACRQIARRVAGEAAGWWAAALYAVFSVGYYSKMQAANTEMLGALPAALAVLAYLDGRRLAAGLLCGLAVLCKQPLALLPLALGAGEVVRAVARRERLLPALLAAALLAAGSLAVLGVMAAYLAARGVLGDAVFWTWTYIWRHYYPAVHDSAILRFVEGPFLMALALAPVVALAAVARGPGRGPVGWWLLGTLAGGFVGSRMFGHYFLPAVAPLCVLAGAGAARVWPTPDARPRLRRATLAGVALLALGQLTGATLFEPVTGSFWRPDPDYRLAAAHLRAVTASGDRIFVWGRTPIFYLAGDRCPATRFVYTHHLAGFAATYQGKGGHLVRRGWHEAMADLRRAPPPYVLDTSHGDYEFGYAPIERFPELWDFVSRRYALETEIAGVRFYRRR